MKKKKTTPEPETKELMVSFMATPAMVEEIDTMAQKLNLTRSQMIRNLLDTGLDDLRVLHASGFIGVVKYSQEMIQAVGAALKSGRVRLVDGELTIK